MREYRVWFTILLVSLQVMAYAQSKDQLEKERKKIIKEIENTTKYLSTTQKEKSSTLNDLKAINNQVENRKKLVDNIKQELVLAEESLKRNELKKDSINKAYEELMDQYAAILRYSYLQQLSNQKISFLLSSESLNTFLLRYQYIKQFESFQKQKKSELNNLRERIVIADENIKIQKALKDSLLTIESEQFNKLEKEQKNKNEVLTKISKKESEIKKDLEKQKAAREKLNQKIEAIILAQLKAAREREEANTASSKADVKLSNSFSQNRGKLPWPVEGGFITTKFGKQSHPTLKGITINSNGIDISCSGNLMVRSVFDGEVVGFIKLSEGNNLLIVKHGQYHSVYSNLSDVVVRQGNTVTTGQVLGSLKKGDDDRAELHFEIWRDKEKMDPKSWLR